MDLPLPIEYRPAITEAAAKRAVDAALPVLKRFHFDPAQYKADVDIWESQYDVSFID